MPRAEKSFRVNAVVLRHADWGEADRLITLLTRERGKVRAIAKGARKIKSRKAGHLEPFTRVALQLAAARDLPIITQAETLEAHLSLREDLVCTGYAAYVVELVDRFSYEDDTEATGLYGLLAETLTRVAAHADPWLAVRYYEMRLLDFLGFRPHLFHCANCGRDILPEDQFFSAERGGVICPTCARGLPGLWDLSMDALKYLRHFQRSSWEEAARARPSPATHAEIETLMQGYFTYLLERSLNTPGFLRHVREG
jgi:DNA repair protein RecO (recombination protein O)